MVVSRSQSSLKIYDDLLNKFTVFIVFRTLFGNYCPKGLYMNGIESHAIGVYRFCQLTDHNTNTSLLLPTSVWVLLSLPIEFEKPNQRLNVPVHGQCGERRSPKVQPSTRPGIEPGTSWLAVRDLTNCTSLANTTLYNSG